MGPLRPSALAEQICAAGLRSLRAVTRATVRELPHKGRRLPFCPYQALYEKQSANVLFGYRHLFYWSTLQLLPTQCAKPCTQNTPRRPMIPLPTHPCVSYWKKYKKRAKNSKKTLAKVFCMVYTDYRCDMIAMKCEVAEVRMP